MRKLYSILTLVVIFSLMLTTAAFAKIGNGNPTGEITAIDQTAGTITLFLEDGTELVVTMPADFDFVNTTLAVGMTVVAKGEWTEDGFNAEWVKETEETEGTAGTEPSEGNTWGEGGVYCNGGKENPHPVAAKIAEMYGVDIDWVMSYACDGHGFGGVMLALQTAEASEGANADDILVKRKEGKGWGQIWKEDGLVKSDKADSPPPGLLKKPDKETGQGKDQGPGQSKAHQDQ
ncbi:MAG: hypothetical protein IH612_01755 [Desulfofustis sp.]|nr:hypothetical protein [Desulfofustis sp.]